MHFKVPSCSHLSALGTYWGQIFASNDVWRSVSPLEVSHPPLSPFSFSRTQVLHHLQEPILYGDILTCIQHEACDDDAVREQLPRAVGQVSGTRHGDEDERGKNLQHPLLPNLCPSLRGWFTSYGPFLLHATVIEGRLDRADCFRHQPSYSPSIRAFGMHSQEGKKKTLRAFPESTSSPSNLPRSSIPQSTDAHWDVRALFSPSPSLLPSLGFSSLFFLSPLSLYHQLVNGSQSGAESPQLQPLWHPPPEVMHC